MTLDNEDLAELIELAESGKVMAQDLYNKVDEVCSQLAEATNQEGIETQIRFLFDQFGFDNLKEELEDIIRDHAASEKKHQENEAQRREKP